MEDGPNSVACPTCGSEVRMGLPRGTIIESVMETPTPELDEHLTRDNSRHKRRRNTCPNDHPFYVYFSF